MSVLFICCKNDKVNDISGNEKTEAVPGKSAPATLQESVVQLDGTWISDDYLTKIEKNKTIYPNPAYKTTLFGFSIMKDCLKDGADYLYGFSKHDAGYTWPVYFNTVSGQIEYDKKRDDGNSPPSKFHISPLSSTKVALVFSNPERKEIYRKADLELELNKLFAGTYTDKSTNKKVTFTSDGKVTGLTDKTWYQVQYDTEGEYAVPFDAIVLFARPDDEAGETFHFKIKGDTLTLYSLNEQEVKKYEEYIYTIGNIAYTLTKN